MNIYTYRKKEEIRNVIIIFSSSYKSTSIININLDFIHFKYSLYVFFYDPMSQFVLLMYN